MTEAAKIKAMVGERGYVKSKITRLASFCADEEALKSSSHECLTEKRLRLAEAFQEYERLNKLIIVIHPEDDEDYGEYEEKYFRAIGVLDKYRANVGTENNTPKGEFKGLPKIQIQPFSGSKVVDYYPFINMFKAVIHRDSNLNSCEKLYYLRSLLTGEALDLIKELTLTDENYIAALNLLEKRYDNIPKIINYHVNCILDMQPFTKCTAQNLRSLISNINLHLAALKNLKQPVEHWDMLLINILAKKVDAYTYRGFYLEKDSKEVPTLSQFLEFVEKRALAIENTEEEKGATAAYSREI